MNTHTFTHYFGTALLVLVLLVVPMLSVSAQLTIPANVDTSKYVMLEPLPCVNTNSGTSGTSNSGSNCTPGTLVGTSASPISVGDYVQYAFNLIIALAAVAAVFMIVWGGFQYMTTDSWRGKSEGLSKVKNAILGLVLVICSYILLKTIDPRLVTIYPTLVPQLQLKCPGDPTKTMADPTCSSNTTTYQTSQNAAQQLNNQAQNSVTAAQQTNQTANNLTQQNANLQTQLDAIKGYGATDDNPQVQALEAQIANNNDQIQQAQVATVVSEDKALTTNQISSALNKMNQAYNETDISSAAKTSILAIDQMTTARVQQLQGLNAPDQITAVKNQGVYAQSAISIDEAVQLANLAVTVETGTWFSTGVGYQTPSLSAKDQIAASTKMINQAYDVVTSQPNLDPALLAQIKTDSWNARQSLVKLQAKLK
jgi:hypothetical protein